MVEICSLSTEVMMIIFSYLDSRTLACVCGVVSREWRHFAASAIRCRDSAPHEDLLMTLSAMYTDSGRLFKQIEEHLESFVTPIVVTVSWSFLVLCVFVVDGWTLDFFNFLLPLGVCVCRVTLGVASHLCWPIG